ncbi:MAG: extracellular solute-binding protein [Spirochaetaceae bacterium]|nr:MAG: extracellular solute-binding protein [Spirochaetaceae bacterium]
MRKSGVVLLVVVGLILPVLLFAGGSAEEADETVELDLWIPGSGEDGEAYEKIIERFEARVENATVSLRVIPWAEYFTVLNTSFAGRVGPDVFGLGFGQLGPVLADGNLLPLNEYLEGWDGWDDISPAMLEAGTSDGTLYAALAPEIRALAIRRDLFEEAGLDPDVPPRSLDELREYAEALTIRDGERIEIQGLDLKSGFNAEQELLQFMAHVGQDRLWTDELEPLFETDAAVEALTIMQSYFLDNISTYSDDLEFGDGLGAMGFMSSNAAPELEAAFGDDVVWHPMPNGRAGAWGTFFAVGNDTRHPEVAVELFKEIMSAEGQMVILEKQGLLPTRRSVEEEFLSLHPRNEVFFEGVQNGYTLGSINPHFFQVIDAIRPAIEEAVFGMKSPEQALSDAAENYRQAVGR